MLNELIISTAGVKLYMRRKGERERRLVGIMAS